MGTHVLWVEVSILSSSKEGSAALNREEWPAGFGELGVSKLKRGGKINPYVLGWEFHLLWSSTVLSLVVSFLCLLPRG